MILRTRRGMPDVSMTKVRGSRRTLNENCEYHLLDGISNEVRVYLPQCIPPVRMSGKEIVGARASSLSYVWRMNSREGSKVYLMHALLCNNVVLARSKDRVGSPTA